MSSPSAPSRTRRSFLLVLLLFSGLAVALTWPLITQLTTHVPGSDTWAYDEYTFLWNIWYFKSALIDQHISPLFTNLTFYPLGMGLVMYTFNLMAAALALPIQLATGNIPLASNLVNLASSVLGGFGTYLLVLYLMRSRARRPAPVRHAPAIIAGLIYAFAASRSVYLALGHYMIVTTQFVPFFLLYFVKLLDRARTRDALLAGLFAALCLLTDMLFGVLLGLMAAVILLVWWWQRRQQPAEQSTPGVRTLLGKLAMMAALAAVISAPLLIPTVREGLNADYAVEGWGHSEKLSADLVGMVTPTDLHPLFGEDREPSGTGWVDSLRAVETGDSPFTDINTVFVGWATLALAVLGAITGGRRSRAWTGIALVAGLLALGPLLQINGQSVFDLDGMQVNVPLPYIVLHYLPFIKGFRAPNRFSIDLMQALAVLAGFGTAWLLGKVAGGGRETKETTERKDGEATPSTLSSPRSVLATILAVVLAAAVIFEHLAVPLPLTDSRVPAPYRELAQQPDDFALLQLPMGWRNGFGVFGTEDTRVQWYQTVHNRPILGGNTSRNPSFKFEYFERLPLLQAITTIEAYGQPDDATDAAARASAAELMALWNVGYVVVNPPVPERYPYVDTWQTSRDYVLDVVPVDPQPVWDADGVQVYRVQQPDVPFPYELDLGSRNTDAWRGPGWSSDEPDIAGANGAWIDDGDAEVFLPLRFEDSQPLQLTLRLQPFSYDGAPPQTVSATFNGVELGEQTLAGGWQEISFAVPADATVSGLNRVMLHFAGTARPVDVLPGQAAIGSTGVQSPVDIEINSGGATQDIAFITVTPPDGEPQDASAGRRGYNLTAIDPQSGAILDTRGFDTWANEFEAEQMASFIESLPDGTIVVGAARDDASRFLTDRAVAALARLGSAVDLRATPGYGHALIGVKGAAPGAAAEATSPDGAYLRLAADRRTLAAAVDWIRLEPAP
ncbi:MAG: hypothetical protein H6646_15600 [Anaerolineales bacterium]|nr:hypothetical protein [Anaerolineales bacterium]